MSACLKAERPGQYREPLSSDARNDQVSGIENYLHMLCGRYRHQLRYGNTYDDLYSVAMLACARVLRLWKPNKGMLTTYITPSVHREIQYWIHIEHRQGFVAIGDSKKNEDRVLINVISGNSEIDDSDRSTSFQDSIPAKPENTVDPHWIDQYLKVLPNERLQRIMRARFVDEKTLQEIADDNGINKERARQLVEQALGILRRHPEFTLLTK